MILGIMQPYFFPYLGYWQLINAVDTYVVYDDVAYIKGGWINRNNILLQGKSNLITLALENASSYKKINEINIIQNGRNAEKIIKTLQITYKKAPYFNQIMPMIENLLLNNSSISILNYNSIIEINKYLGINTKILLSSELKKDNFLKAQDKVIHINKILNADTYINAIGGQELYNKKDFEKEDINLQFLKINELKYTQFDNEFVPNLSVIDVLMFNSPNKIGEMLNDYSII